MDPAQQTTQQEALQLKTTSVAAVLQVSFAQRRQQAAAAEAFKTQIASTKYMDGEEPEDREDIYESIKKTTYTSTFSTEATRDSLIKIEPDTRREDIFIFNQDILSDSPLLCVPALPALPA